MHSPPMLRGAPNFRDIGDYLSSVDPRIRRGRVFRSQGLDRLTDEDLTVLRGLDVRLVCDLRSVRERNRHPSRWPADSRAQHLDFDVRADVRANNQKLLDLLRADPSADGARAVMMASYSSFPTTFADVLARLFARMAQDEAFPMLVHCSAGKDRTGFVVAMLLSALGVDRELILDDYLHTARVIDSESLLEATADSLTALLGYTPSRDALIEIATVRREFLQASFRVIESDYGSVDNYLTSACGLTGEIRRHLASRLLE